ncbi:hypothetical protein BX286_1519 [Streptomyces sp. 3211.6]|uniref:hypothetical protein n=1 Tax=Streptomyces TaxID=1883 RepID=UPI0009A51323|nr:MULTISPECIES: hypothetical protein [Streptomyces]RKT03589.1 hypothetical protein BX286_1519 [Streptomyces sp. 3211.6]RPF39458.1 hypothetical protein EDD96_3195 [Streptomyces sp. Ag109_G2-6]
MPSFATHRLRVHDASLPPHRRLSALRTCLTVFCPYGFYATYHHLCRSAGIPRELGEDPGSLVRAVEELHEARLLWLDAMAVWRVGRRAQKRAGVRRPEPPEPAQGLFWPNPEFHPGVCLAEVMPGVMRGRLDVEGDQRRDGACPVCARDRGTVQWDGSGHGRYTLCAGCGLGLGRRPPPLPHGPQRGDVRAGFRHRQRLIWAREV